MDTDEVDARLTALERDVARLRDQQVAIAADAQAARLLAAGADREVAQIGVELRAHRQLLNALRETQRDHADRLDRIDDRLDRIESQLVAVDERMAAGFATMQQGMSQIVALLTDRDT